MNDANLFASALRSKKRAGLAIALTSLLLIVMAPPAVELASQTTSAENLHMRARVGHFAHYQVSDPLATIYQLYFENVLKNSDSSLSSLDINDWRRARPSGSVCLDYLRQLRVQKLVLARPFDIVMMDACLDWLYGDDRDSDRTTDVNSFSLTQKKNLKLLQGAKELKDIYSSTKFANQEIPERLKNEVYKYLEKLFTIHGTNPGLGCHGEWLDTYMDFIENIYMPGCESPDDCMFYELEDARKDSYLRMIADSTVKSTKDCYNTMLEHIGETLKTAKEEHTAHSSNFATRMVMNAVKKQQEQEKWTKEMTRVLQIAQGVNTNTRVELGDVAVQLERIKDEDDEAIATFTREVAHYANENANMANSANDFNGRRRYGEAMTKLCKPFVDYDEFLATTGGYNTDGQKTGKPFDFYKIVYSLIRATNYQQLIGISSKQFEEDVIKNNWEAVYLATFACHVVFNSWGMIVENKNTPQYKVELEPHAMQMLAMWPIEVMSERLPILYPKSSAASSSTSVFDMRPKRPKFLRGKIIPKFSHKNRKNADQDQDLDPAQAPAQAAAQLPSRAPGQVQHQSGQIEDQITGPQVMSRPTLRLYLYTKGRFPLDTTDEYFTRYPELVDCLPEDMLKQYKEHKSFGKGAFLGEVAPVLTCKF